MKLEPPKSAASPIMWFAVLGAPFAWGIEFAAGYWMTQTGCSVPGRVWDLNQDALGAALMAVCFAVAVAVAAGLVSVAMFRGTRDSDDDDAPPAGRVHFLAAIGMTVTILFVFIIVMTGLGIVILPDCHQS